MHCFPIEVGVRGFIVRSTMYFLSNIGVSGKNEQSTIKSLQEDSEAASKCILAIIISALRK